MSTDLLFETATHQFHAVELCLASQLRAPALVLIYTGIDFMASFSRPREAPKVTRQHYLDWVERYLLPNGQLDCSAIDIYSARCALVHTYGATSALTESGKARSIGYAWGTRKPEEAQQVLDQVGITDHIFIHVGELFDAFKQGATRFLDDVGKDPVKIALVERRAGELFQNYDTFPGQPPAR
jgi:hypothetical protein